MTLKKMNARYDKLVEERHELNRMLSECSSTLVKGLIERKIERNAISRKVLEKKIDKRETIHVFVGGFVLSLIGFALVFGLFLIF